MACMYPWHACSHSLRQDRASAHNDAPKPEKQLSQAWPVLSATQLLGHNDAMTYAFSNLFECLQLVTIHVQAAQALCTK